MVLYLFDIHRFQNLQGQDLLFWNKRYLSDEGSLYLVSGILNSWLSHTWDSIHLIQEDELGRILDCLYKMSHQLLKYGDLTVLSKIPKEMKSYIISYINYPFHMQNKIYLNYYKSNITSTAKQVLGNCERLLMASLGETFLSTFTLCLYRDHP